MIVLDFFQEMIKGKNDKDNSAEKFLSEMADISFRESINREKSILDQSGKMQLAFSFVIMAVLTAYGFTRNVCYGEEFHKACLWVTGVISILLIISLWLATMATYRFKYTSLGSVEELQEYTKQYKEKLVTIEQQQHSKISYLKKAQKSIDTNNDTRLSFLIWSIRLFLLTLFLIPMSAVYIVCRL